MRAIVISDNVGCDGLGSEWGLSFYIEYGEHILLLDAGASDLFAENAYKLGLHLEQVDCAVLSHAHFDHGDGLPVFFQQNQKAQLFLQESCGENCYDRSHEQEHYIGLAPGLLAQYEHRLHRVASDRPFCLFQGAWLIPHSTPGLAAIGEAEHMYQKGNGHWQADDFAHEQSLVLHTDEGRVLFNSCSHSGADVVIREASAAFPGHKLRAVLGGFHLFNKDETTVRALARRIAGTGIRSVYTGHCTGRKAFDLLREELGDMVQQFHVGQVITF